jgi:peptide-methionine (S)-S-oxide reductase
MLKEKIGFGGSCHWCTEAIFNSLIGILNVEQGWVSSIAPEDAFSEGVIVHFDPNIIDLSTLISIHLHTHSCTSKHSMRQKYRSAIYNYTKEQLDISKITILHLQKAFDEPIITKIIPFQAFKLNSQNYLDYYYKNPDNPFCQNIINPKLKVLLKQYSTNVNREKLVI